MIFEIINKKGSGYFCNVFKARNEEGKIVAIKQLKKEFSRSPDYVYRFKREVTLLNELSDSSYIIKCLDHSLDVEKETYLYMMPMADFHLHKYIQTYNNQISFKERLLLFDQILEGIKYAHTKGILHRDIAPNNILLFLGEQNIQVRISDFGLGKDHNSLSHFTKSVGSYGQHLYVAPEQFENLKNATLQSDIYSLGKLLYFVTTGKNPLNIKQGVKFQSLIEKATHDDLEKRHNSIEDFIHQYERLKGLYLDSEETPKYETIKLYIANNKEKINWNEFHRMVLEANVIDHVFDDYLEPIVEQIRKKGALENYISCVNEEITNFLEIFCQNLHKCYKKTRWPFSYLDTFGDFFNFLYKNLSQTQAKLICLKELWHISFESDQWNPQKLMESLIRGKIDNENLEPFAEFLIESKSQYAYKIFNNGRLSEINPIIRTSLQIIIEGNKKVKD